MCLLAIVWRCSGCEGDREIEVVLCLSRIGRHKDEIAAGVRKDPARRYDSGTNGRAAASKDGWGTDCRPDQDFDDQLLL
jgi:hypothetical protein